MEGTKPAGAGRFVAAAAVVFLGAILLARLILYPGMWPWAVLLSPIALVLLSLAFGFVRALILVALFVATVLAFLLIVDNPAAGWPVLLLGPAVLLALTVAVKVVLKLRPQAPKTGEEREEDRA